MVNDDDGDYRCFELLRLCVHRSSFLLVMCTWLPPLISTHRLPSPPSPLLGSTGIKLVRDSFLMMTHDQPTAHTHTRSQTEKGLKKVEDDKNGHLLYKMGDTIQERCTATIFIFLVCIFFYMSPCFPLSHFITSSQVPLFDFKLDIKKLRFSTLEILFCKK